MHHLLDKYIELVFQTRMGNSLLKKFFISGKCKKLFFSDEHKKFFRESIRKFFFKREKLFFSGKYKNDFG